MSSPHDHIYKQLFSHPEMVRELLRGFVPQAWAQQLELEALERVNASYVGERGAQRHDDLVWRVRLDGDWIYLYLLLELQARPDHWMALRMQVYVGLLYQDLVRQRQLTRGGKLPPVLPVVLYHGARPWNAPAELSDLMLPAPDGLQALQPRQGYMLVDGAKAADDDTHGNLVAALFHLLHARDRAAMELALARFVAHLHNPVMSHVKASLSRWMDFVLKEKAIETMVMMDSDTEADMLKRIDHPWRDWDDFIQWMEDRGREKALEQGLKQGLEQGQEQARQEVRQMLRDWMNKAGLPLTEHADSRIATAALPQMVQWLSELAQGRSVEQVFTGDAPAAN